MQGKTTAKLLIGRKFLDEARLPVSGGRIVMKWNSGATRNRRFVERLPHVEDLCRTKSGGRGATSWNCAEKLSRQMYARTQIRQYDERITATRLVLICVNRA